MLVLFILVEWIPVRDGYAFPKKAEKVRKRREQLKSCTYNIQTIHNDARG